MSRIASACKENQKWTKCRFLISIFLKKFLLLSSRMYLVMKATQVTNNLTILVFVKCSKPMSVAWAIHWLFILKT